MEAGCSFCKIFYDKGYEELYPDGAYSVMRIAPLNPVTLGHKLFVPVEHFRDAAQHPYLSAMVQREAASFGFVQAENFNLITSAGSAATQTVMHMHWHYIPRREGDGLMLPWSNQKKESDA